MQQKFFRPFDYTVSQDDINLFVSMMREHGENKTLDYHGYLNPKKTFRTQFGKDMRELADKLGLKLAGIFAFTAHAGSVTSKHIDGDEDGPLKWRLCFYVGGEPGILSWYPITRSEFDKNVGAHVVDNDEAPLYSQVLEGAGFVRTEYPHVLDLSNTKTDRLTITATFSPQIDWDTLNVRLDDAFNAMQVWTSYD
jgi:hypothetical protein